MIKKWGLKFEEQKNIIPNYSDIYNRLKDNGVEFPEYNGPDYNIYFPKNFISTEDEKNNYKDENINNNVNNNDNNNEDSFYYFEELKKILKEENFQHKYRRLVAFLLKMNENIKLANELIDLKDIDNLKDVLNTLNDGNNTLIDTITGGRLKDDKLMEYTLGTTEDINRTILREDDLKNGVDVQKFISYFEINNTIPRKTNNSNNINNKKNDDFFKFYIEENNEKNQ